jgi:hypothetical protein
MTQDDDLAFCSYTSPENHIGYGVSGVIGDFIESTLEIASGRPSLSVHNLTTLRKDNNQETYTRYSHFASPTAVINQIASPCSAAASFIGLA